MAHWKVLPCAEPAGQGNDFELIPMVRMDSQHSIGAPTCHDFPRFVIISEKSLTMITVFFGKRPLKGIFFSKNYFERIQRVTEPRLVCKFHEIWLIGNRQSRALFTWQKKTKYRLHSHSRFCVDHAQNLSGQLLAICSACPIFHPNPYTSGGVIAGHMNIVETCNSVSNTLRSCFTE